ncbi:hypothetical protein G3I74_06165 [Wenzhouxiangella sp. C33]|uniref:Transcriptional regulator n=1 Tax=Wenzhouxiangella limi TaxID=2707351 RepID=A0A845VDG7_9GAMM|nr:hypothetical protein [Wenzhouxiangella limi]NDY95309.1 hypothetical protein [Wenzhouxiangella limi]
MQTLTEALVKSGVANRVLRDEHLADWLEGSAQRRYNLVNRAMAAGEMVRLARGIYVLDPKIAGSAPHAFVVAQHLRPGSFVSFEAALTWHGCIPEAVRLITSVVPGRRKAQFSVPLYGDFRFVPLALRTGCNLVAVRRVQFTGGIALVADPLRALLDLMCWRKIPSESAVDFLEGLRLEFGCFDELGADDLARMRGVYQHRRMEQVVDQFWQWYRRR